MCGGSLSDEAHSACPASTGRVLQGPCTRPSTRSRALGLRPVRGEGTSPNLLAGEDEGASRGGASARAQVEGVGVHGPNMHSTACMRVGRVARGAGFPGPYTSALPPKGAADGDPRDRAGHTRCAGASPDHPVEGGRILARASRARSVIWRIRTPRTTAPCRGAWAADSPAAERIVAVA